MSARYAVLIWTLGSPPVLAATGRDRPDQRPALIPRPVEMKISAGAFELTPSTRILVDGAELEVRAIAEYLIDIVQQATGMKLQLHALPPGRDVDDGIVLKLHDNAPNDERYVLTVADRRVTLAAPQPRGLFYAVQTLRQIMPSDVAAGRSEIPALHIVDQPRYRWRGMLLDCGRHFMSKEFIKRYIDLLAYHKLNVLHWHLTEDQGWRIEIKKYPELTRHGVHRTDPDKKPLPKGKTAREYYTQEEIRRIILGRKHSLIRQRFKNAGQLRLALENLEWP